MKINDTLYRDRKIIIDKVDKKLHGIGLKSIRESFEKCGGDINIEILDNKFNFKRYYFYCKNQLEEISIY